MLTARDTVGDRVTGLDAGADDYLVKPFAYEELAARLRALGRRGDGAPAAPSRSSSPARSSSTRPRGGSRSTASRSTSARASSRCSSACSAIPGQTLSRDQLLDQAWPFSVAVTPNAVDAYVHYLRDKLGAAGRLIETVRGVGYRLADA